MPVRIMKNPLDYRYYGQNKRTRNKRH